MPAQEFSFSTAPQNYDHLKLTVDGDEAVLLLNINQHKNLAGNTPLKLNSYDLGVDIELADAVNRLRFEHPGVKVVTISSALNNIFSAGANIYMLKKSSHAFKVNFCKFTNETRLYIEEASQFSHIKFLCAVNGTAAGGGYELALACDRIVLVDDKSASVSLPEVPLLGVLPGTGGLTRLIDKRKVRRDIADVFCTLAEGFKGTRAKESRVVDEIYPKSQWQDGIKHEVARLKAGCRDKDALGIKLTELSCSRTAGGFAYRYVDVGFADRKATLTLKGPGAPEPTNPKAMLERGDELWLLRMARELDDAILRLRFFHRDVGLIKVVTQGEHAHILSAEAPLYGAFKEGAHWFVRELALLLGRVFRRLDTTSRSIYCAIEPDSAFVGLFAELLLIADRSYGRAAADKPPKIAMSALNNGLLPTWSQKSRLELRLWGQPEILRGVQKLCDQSPLSLGQAKDLGLVTFVLDDIDYADEVRVFEEERASLSPDALSAMEANLRFVGQETLATKIFGRLSAWQNWVFGRDNATGPKGALMSYGEGSRAAFDFERC